MADDAQPDELSFPRGTGTSTVHLTRVENFHAWSGKPDQLVRIAKEAEASLATAFAEAQPGLMASAGLFRKERVVEAYALNVRVTASSGRIERTGGISAILAEMDAREIEYVELKSGISPLFSDNAPSLSVRFGSDPKYSSLYEGVEVKVTGADRQWVGGTFDRLVTEVVKGVPRWHVLRSPLGQVALATLIAAPVFALVLWQLPTTDAPTSLIFGMVSGTIGFGITSALMRWALIDFEVVDVGSKSRARRAGAVAVTILGLCLAAAGVLLAV